MFQILRFPLLISICLLFASFAYSQKISSNILFIGNSLTFYNDMPQMLRQIANSHNHSIMYDRNTKMGYSLRQHASNDSTMRLIRKGNWNFVVIQGLSLDFTYYDQKGKDEVLPYLYAIVDSIKKYNTRAQIVLYMTWGYKEGDEQACVNEQRLCSYSEMQKVISDNYIQAAAHSNMWVAPVGEVWQKIQMYYPKINLYQSDNLHPTAEGSYAAASVFYALLFQEPVNSNYYDVLKPKAALQIQSAASETVLQYSNLWKNTSNFQADTIYAREIKIYPIPAKETITIDLMHPFDKPVTIELYSFLGEPLEKLENVMLPYTINILQYKHGTYFMKIVYKTTTIFKTIVVK